MYVTYSDLIQIGLLVCAIISLFLTYKKKLMTKDEYEEYFKEPGTLKNRCIRYLKSNVGRGNAMKNLEKLIDLYEYVSIENYLKISALNQVIKI